MMALLRMLGSARSTAIISGGLIILLIVSTSMEAIHGTPFAQKVFYQAQWFDFLVALLWVNIFCSTVIRFPFKKNQIGFLITHIGILILLIGALITRTYSLEGEVALYEGESTDFAKQSAYSLAVVFPNQEDERFDLRKGNFAVVMTKARLDAKAQFCPLQNKRGPKASSVAGSGDKLAFTITDILERAVQRIHVAPGNVNGTVNRAARVTVKSRTLNLNSTLWLVEHDPYNPLSGENAAGPVSLKLSEVKTAALSQTPVLHVLDRSGNELLAIDMEKKPIPEIIAVPKTDVEINKLAYYPYAAVGAGKKIINAPEGRTRNPAVEFDVKDKKGGITHEIRFAFFPEFASMHPSDKPVHTDLQFKFEAGEHNDQGALPQGLQVGIHYADNGVWTYETQFQDKTLGSGALASGTCAPSGWMDVEFCADELLSRARVSYDIGASTDMTGVLAAMVTVPSVSGAEPFWVLEDKETTVRTPAGTIAFVLTAKTLPLPFSLALKKFRRIDYPGTDTPASFESDVSLKDAKNGITMERTISMNRPLMYDGYKIFQSSYMQDAQYGNGSVFSVAKNPGIPWIYIGSVFACIGALFQFYGVKEKDAA
ncbi:MAG: cytochrome c biogenesis protein ResB [Candidatus Omnitrophica bacterium]|nr:cytochrome c biogenesis protein ResB [Candidatus Omnitrophota bacterium]